MFIQMEDELASMAAILGASWAGSKSMTVTSGPGFSLMQENIGLGAMMEVPCVIVDVQRGSPSTGLPTTVGQGDVMQARWGSHGDYEIIALAPNSPQECFNIMPQAFNLSEKYRVPTIVLMDECTSHMSEKVVIPKKKDIKLVDRKKPTGKKEKYLPYKAGKDMVPPMAIAGEGYNICTTGLTHNEKGYPDLSAECQDSLVRRLCDKIRFNTEDIIQIEGENVNDAEVIVVAYGTPSRSAKRAVALARDEGIKAGMLRLFTVWPFPEKQVRKLALQAKSFVVPEINYGQVVLEVDRCAAGNANVYSVPKMGGELHSPEEILNVIEKAAGEKTVKGGIQYA